MITMPDWFDEANYIKYLMAFRINMKPGSISHRSYVDFNGIKITRIHAHKLIFILHLGNDNYRFSTDKKKLRALGVLHGFEI